MNIKKVSDETVVDIYRSTHSIWKTAQRVSLCGQSVSERLKRLGIECKGNSIPAPMLIHVCPTCKKEFHPDGNRKRLRYCSRECGYRGRPKREQGIYTCLDCGKELPTEKRKNKYCSKECRRANWWLPKRCPICFGEFETRRSRIKKYCSLQCRNKAITLRQMGVNSHFWQGGKTDPIFKVRGHPLYDEWRKKVFERDQYTCQICLEVGGKLTAHHIAFFASNPRLRFRLHNGITLCWPCHTNFHHCFGNGRLVTKESQLSNQAKRFFDTEPGVVMFKSHGNVFTGSGRPDWTGTVLGRYVAIELKTYDNFLTPVQKFFLEKLKKAGAVVFVCHSLDEVKTAIVLIKESVVI